MLTMSEMIVRCSLKAVEECAYMLDLKKVWDEELYHKPSVRYEDPQTGGGGVRLTWRNDICWITNHSGYQLDLRHDAFVCLTQLSGAEPIQYERDEYMSSYHGWAEFEDFCHVDEWRASATVVHNHLTGEDKVMMKPVIKYYPGEKDPVVNYPLKGDRAYRYVRNGD